MNVHTNTSGLAVLNNVIDSTALPNNVSQPILTALPNNATIGSITSDSAFLNINNMLLPVQLILI
jgi:hypothetical protein